ncbi:hypothetical protein [Stutzerimonas nitrititolerans]|uniref:hypothetical protein n=1 Tax=Stutzerimonas nitrititolerans TaxID=2482751 RepID=UPI0028B1F504|nr:hypothetical protein [Stutzerimonas nitrititolerans]
MKKRKPYNPMKRYLRERKALLRLHRVAVVTIDPSGKQGLIDWKTCKNIAPGRTIAESVCDIAHHWTIYLAGFCIDDKGERYIKPLEIAPEGIYVSDDLAEVIRHYYTELRASCNPRNLVGSGWVANPSGKSLTEHEATMIFEAVGAWPAMEKAA